MAWIPSPSYLSFITDTWYYYSTSIQDFSKYDFPNDTIRDLKLCFANLPSYFYIYISLLAILWTILRNIFTKHFIAPICQYFRLPILEQSKVPESAWKFTFYFISWSFVLYVLLIKEEGRPILDPNYIFNEWSMDKQIPLHYYIIQAVQLSFYIHSLYATIFLDNWRKDSYILFYHHIITCFLLLFVFSIRCHIAATLTLFCHDICDIFLEGTKVILYFKIQANQLKPVLELLANIGFGIFTVLWFISRLYIFPLRVIYPCACYLIKEHINVPFHLFLNSMMYMLLIMNIYWFSLIIKLLWRVLFGQTELEDTRDYNRHEDSSMKVQINDKNVK